MIKVLNVRVKGSDIDNICTQRSKYDNNCVLVKIEDNIFYMKIKELFKFDTDFNNLIFKIVKKRKHHYLEVMQNEKNN